MYNLYDRRPVRGQQVCFSLNAKRCTRNWLRWWGLPSRKADGEHLIKETQQVSVVKPKPDITGALSSSAFSTETVSDETQGVELELWKLSNNFVCVNTTPFQLFIFQKNDFNQTNTLYTTYALLKPSNWVLQILENQPFLTSNRAKMKETLELRPSSILC